MHREHRRPARMHVAERRVAPGALREIRPDPSQASVNPGFWPLL